MEPIFKIEEHIATLSTGPLYTVELNLVSFNNYPAKYDIRRWSRSPEGDTMPGKGIHLNFGELKALRTALDDLMGEKEEC